MLRKGQKRDAITDSKDKGDAYRMSKQCGLGGEMLTEFEPQIMPIMDIIII